MKRLKRIGRSRLTVAIAAVTLTAVVVAGGLAGALPGTRTVETNDLQTGSVNSRAVKNNNLRSRDIRNATLQGKDMRENTLTGREINESTLRLTGAEIDESTLRLTGAEIDESTLGPVPAADSLTGVSIVLINHRSGDTSPTPIAVVGELTIRVTCSFGTENITATTTASGDNEIASTSWDASLTETSYVGEFDDLFGPGETFSAAPGTSSTERQYTITYSAASGANVTAVLITEDTVGGSNCVVSGYAIG